MTNEQLLYTIIQGGSFAVLVVIIVWVGRTLVPSSLSAFRDQGTRFDAALQRQEDRHAVELQLRDVRDARSDDALARLISAVDRLTDRIERLEDHSKTNSPVKG